VSLDVKRRTEHSRRCALSSHNRMTDQPGSYDVHMNYTYNCAPLIEDTRSVLTVISFKYYVSLIKNILHTFHGKW